MRIVARLNILLAFCTCTLFAQSKSQFDTSKIDATLERSGTWTEGVYLVVFPRSDLHVTLQGVRLSVSSLATFMGTEDHAEMMGEICALPGEVTPSIAKLRVGGIEISGAHNHFLGESPRLMFIHFMARGRVVELARAFREAVAATSTPLGKPAPPAVQHPEPEWAKALESAFGRHGDYSAGDQQLIVDFFRADFPAGPMDFWYQSSLFFQPAPNGKIVGTGDIAVTAAELNQVLTILTEHGFQIEGVHNHMIDEQPRLFFAHYWKISTPQDLADSLKAALAATRTRGK